MGDQAANLDISVTVRDLTSEGFAKINEALKLMNGQMHETGGTGIWFVDQLKDLGDSFAGRVAEGLLLRDAIRGIGSVVKDAAMAFPELVDKLVETGRQLYDLSLKTGASVEGLSKMRYIAGQTGVDFGSFSASLYKMEVALGSSGDKAIELLQKLTPLGLNLKQLKDEKPDQAFFDIMQAFEKIPNRADQAAIGMAIFGKGFKDMAGLTQESMADMMKQAQDLGLVMSTDTAAAADAAGDAFDRMKMQVEALGFKIAGAFLPALVGLENDLSVGLNEAVKTLNSSLGAMGSGDGFLAMVARAMGKGDEATKAQIDLYVYLKEALISVAKNGLEPMITATGFVMTEWNAAKVVFGDIMQIIDGDALAFEYLALGVAKVMQFLHAGDWTDDINRINGNIDSLLVTMKKRGDELAKDKDAEREWGNWAVLANEAVEAALNKVGAAHTDVQAIIAHGAEVSRKAFGGVGQDIGDADAKTKKYVEAWKELNATGATYLETLATLTPQQQKVIEGYLRAGNSVGVLAAAFPNLTESQIKAVDELVKNADKYADEWEKAQHRITATWNEAYGIAQQNSQRGLALKIAELNTKEQKERDQAAAEIKDATQLEEMLSAIHLKYENQRAKVTHDDAAKTAADTRKIWDQYYDVVSKEAIKTTDTEIAAVNRWYENEVQKAHDAGVVDQQYYDALAALAQAKMQDVLLSHNQTFQAIKVLLQDLQEGPGGFVDTFSQTLAHTGSFSEAFEAVWKQVKSDVENIFGAMLESIISGFLSPLLDNVKSVAADIGKMLMNALTGSDSSSGFGGFITGSTSATPGGGLGGLLGKLGGVFGGGAGAAAGAGAGAAGAAGGAASMASGAGAVGGGGAAAGGGAFGGLGSVATFLATNPIGWAIDAGIAALVLWNHFSGPDKNEIAGREVKEQWNADIWKGLTKAQQEEAAHAGWANQKDAGAMIFWRDQYAKMGRPDPERSAENYIQNVWGTIPKGYDAMHAAIKDVASFAEQGIVRGPTLAMIGDAADKAGGEMVLWSSTVSEIRNRAYNSGAKAGAGATSNGGGIVIVPVAIDPKSGAAVRQLTRDEQSQIIALAQKAAGQGLLRIPARAVVGRVVGA